MFFCEIIKRDKFLLENGIHKKNSLLIVLEGAFEFSFDGEKQIARENDIVFFPKNMRFTRHVMDAIKCLYIQSDSDFRSVECGLLKTSDTLRKNNTLIHLTEAVLYANDYLIHHYIRDIIILTEHISCSPDKRIIALIEYIEQNYAATLSLDDLSSIANMSKQGFISAFKRSTGKTPIEYLNFIRLQNSKEFLKYTDHSIGEISELCGFSNVYYFSNTFKKNMGISPNMFRKSIRL